MANVRIRGKIRHEEWPKIAERFQNGETLTEIARSYHCTAPAIRYIVQRVAPRGGKYVKANRSTVDRLALLTSANDHRRADHIGNVRKIDPQAAEIWGRINSDIAGFLAAVDSVAADDSEESFESLLAATDRLLWASARTRLEVERVLAEKRKGTGVRRLSR